MKLGLLGLTVATVVALPGGWWVQEGTSSLAVCEAGSRTDLFRRQLQFPTTVAVVPGMGEVSAMRRFEAGCGCREGEMRCELRHLAVSELD